MRKINIAIISRNTFLRASLMAIIHDLTRASDALTIEFSGHSSELSAQDIIIAEILPGEIHLCNTSIKNRKKNSSVIILHRYDELPEKTRIVNCLKDVTFVPVRTVNIDSLREIIGRRSPGVKSRSQNGRSTQHQYAPTARTKACRLRRSSLPMV